MKILMLCNRVPWPLHEGGNLATWNLALHLKKEGHSVELACLNTQKHFVPLEEVPPLLDGIHAIPIDTTIRWKGVFQNLFSPLPYIAERFVSADFQMLLEKLLRKNTYEIIQLEGLYMSPYIETIRRFTQTPIVLRAHNVEYKIWERVAQAESHPIKRTYLKGMTQSLKRFEARQFRKVNGVLFFTKADAALGLTLAPGISHTVIPSGIDIPENSGGSGKIPKSMGFIGSMDWMPNQDGIRWFVKEVLPLIRKRLPEVRLLIAGRNISENLLEGLDTTRVELLGEVPQASDFVQSIEVMVTPLRAGGGMRLKILEAMACGAAIVSTTVGAEGIEVTHQEHLILADDAETFSESVMRLMNQDTERLTLGEAARKRAIEYYSWQPIARKTSTYYLQLL